MVKRFLLCIAVVLFVLFMMTDIDTVRYDRPALSIANVDSIITKGSKCSQTYDNALRRDFNKAHVLITENGLKSIVGKIKRSYEKTGTEEEYQEISAETENSEAEIFTEAIGSDSADPDINGGIYSGNNSEDNSGDNSDYGDEYSVSEVDESGLVYVGDWTVTFYCQCEQCCGKWAWSNSTASGAVPQAGWTVAAGPSYPFGTILEIEGFGTYEVQDRGVPDGRVDIYVNDHSEIPSYGMTVSSVYIVEG